MASYKYSVYNSAKRNTKRGSGGRGGQRGEYINPARFVAVAKPTQAVDYMPKHQFSDFPLDERLQTNLTAKGL